MKRSIVITILCLAMALPVFADDGGIVKKDYAVKAGEAMRFTGIFKSMTSSGLTRVDPYLVATDAGGNDVEFRVLSTAVIYNSADGKLRSMTELVPGEELEVSYKVAKEGGFQAIAVKVISKIEPPKEK